MRALVSFLLSVLVEGPIRCSRDFTDLEDILAGVFLFLAEGVHNFVQSVSFLQNSLDSTVKAATAYATYIRSLEVYWYSEECISWYHYSTATG